MATGQWNRIGGWLKRHSRLVAIILVIAAATGGVAYAKFFREVPAPYFVSDEEHFLFGSTGTETSQGVPDWIWLVLPRLFPEHLPRPGGYAALGILGKDGHEMPVGLSKVTIGFPRVGVNCAICHAARWRGKPGDPPTIVAAGPAHQTGYQEYLRFLVACASDSRFTVSTVLGEIAKNHRLSLLDRVLYRLVIIPSTRRALLRLARENRWMDDRPDWGRGRSDALNRVKFPILRQPPDATVGHADTMPLWNLSRHEGMAFDWDGLNGDLKEMVLSSALAEGASRSWVDRDMRRWDNSGPRDQSSLRRIQNYIRSAAPPKYPLPIDQTLSRQGQLVFDSECAACHAFGGTRTGTVTPIAEVGTDRHRLDTWTAEAATAFNAHGEGHDWKFSGFRKTAGYVSEPLDGVWLRAPYLHNGSVPTLLDLLEPPAARPAKFWRGYDVYDAVNGGFVSSGPDAQRVGTLHDTSEPGNSNAGHLYGTGLPPPQKRALLEVLENAMRNRL